MLQLFDWLEMKAVVSSYHYTDCMYNSVGNECLIILIIYYLKQNISTVVLIIAAVGMLLIMIYRYRHTDLTVTSTSNQILYHDWWLWYNIYASLKSQSMSWNLRKGLGLRNANSAQYGAQLNLLKLWTMRQVTEFKYNLSIIQCLLFTWQCGPNTHPLPFLFHAWVSDKA